jgi:hypothetical protein
VFGDGIRHPNAGQSAPQPAAPMVDHDRARCGCSFDRAAANADWALSWLHATAADILRGIAGYDESSVKARLPKSAGTLCRTYSYR